MLAEAEKIGTVNTVYFEGGEPLLYFPLLVASVKAAHEAGFSTGMVTNGYMSTSIEDAGLWLQPLIEAGLDYLRLSDDEFHSDDRDNPARRALAAAQKLGLDSGAISISRPAVLPPGDGQAQGAPVIGGGAMFRGRAVEKLTPGLPVKAWNTLTECTHEKLADPGRVHVDHLGNVHLCQGLIMGNMWETPLSELVKNYQARENPICGPSNRGRPGRTGPPVRPGP